jgi:hypothetical protein
LFSPFNIQPELINGLDLSPAAAKKVVEREEENQSFVFFF